MQPVVFKQELRLHGFGVVGIAHRLVEVYHSVEHLRAANPLVQCATPLLVVGRVVVVAFEWCDCSTKHIYTFLVCFAYDLLIHVDDAFGCLHTILSTSQVVHGFKQYDPLHAFLTQQVALISVHGSRPQTSAEHTVATDAHVEHRYMTRRFVGQQSARKHIGPAVLLVGGRTTPVGNRIAQNGHSARFLGSFNLKCQDVIPVVGSSSSAEVRSVTLLQVRRGARAGMSAHIGRRSRPIVYGDCHILPPLKMEVHRVGHHLAFCRNGNTSIAVKRKAHRRALVNCAAAAGRLGICQFHSLYLCLTIAELVCQLQSHPFATYRHLHNLAQRVATQSRRRRVVVVLYQLRSRAPCAHPTTLGKHQTARHEASKYQYRFLHCISSLDIFCRQIYYLLSTPPNVFTEISS